MTNRYFLLLLVSCILSTGSIAAVPPVKDTVFYNYVNSGKIVGRQWVFEKEKNDYYYFDEYNDRGRGPSIHGHITTNDRGIITLAEFSGVDYMKTAVLESYHVTKGKAYWKNKFENDSSSFRDQLYSDINGPSAEYGLILKMLQTNAAGELPVLPAGTRGFKKITSTEIPLANSSQKLSLQLIAFSGYGGPPFYMWFTQAGQFFGTVSDWSSLIQKGYEGQAAALYAIQRQFESSFFGSLAEKLIEHPATGIAIKNASLFDPLTGKALPRQTILVKGDRIEKTGDAATTAIPTGYKVIDGTGKFCMAGLWEMHGHFSKDQGPFMLAQGVTNLRDMGNGPELLQTRDQIRKDSILGPDITVISGFIDRAGEFAAPTGVLINSLDEGLKAIDDYKSKGYDQIKLYSSIEPAWVKPMAARAHSVGMRVCGHIPAYMTASQAIDAGYDEVTHINMLMLNFFGDTIDTRSMGRFLLPGRKGYAIDVQGPEVQTFIRQLQDKHIVLDPTVGVFEEMFVDLPGHVSKKYAPIAAFLPPEIKRASMNGGYVDKDSLIGTYEKSYANLLRLLKECYDKKITILSGTDGGILQHELEIYSQSGIPNADVLKMATWWPAKVSGKDDQLGSIAENKIANLVLIDGNPLQHMEDIRKVYCTIKTGELYWPKDIYKTFGWNYYY